MLPDLLLQRCCYTLGNEEESLKHWKGGGNGNEDVENRHWRNECHCVTGKREERREKRENKTDERNSVRMDYSEHFATQVAR
jgi:hypothetical protein